MTSRDARGLGDSVTTSLKKLQIFLHYSPLGLSTRHRILRRMGMEDIVVLAGNTEDRVGPTAEARHYARVV